MRLTDRGRAHGYRLDPREHLVDGPIQLQRDELDIALERQGGQSLEEVLELRR